MWVGGDDTCDHVPPFQPRSERPNASASGIGRGGDYADEQARGSAAYRRVCGKCGAVRVDKQIGGEDVPDCQGWATGDACGGCFVCHIVQLGRGLRHVMRDDAVWWLNLGDTYSSGGGARSVGRNDVARMYGEESQRRGLESQRRDLPAGNLCMVPARCALALQADGWYLRNDIIWYAPNKMPESVTSRCSKSHEHVFLLAKSMDYFYDAEAIKEEGKVPYRSSDFVPDSEKDAASQSPTAATAASSNGRSDELVNRPVNKRDVWVVPTSGFAGAHFATYSPRLITPCILAGTSEAGCCSACGAQWERVVKRSGGVAVQRGVAAGLAVATAVEAAVAVLTVAVDHVPHTSKTVGWQPTCDCGADTVPSTVFDPFLGSGTTVATAVSLGRRGAGVDLSEVYLSEHAVPRIKDAIGAAQRAAMERGDVYRPPLDAAAEAVPVKRRS